MFRFEYDRVEAYHPYRTEQPWDLGGVRLLQIDGVNGDVDDTRVIRGEVDEVELRLARDAYEAGIGHAKDNHYGYTVVVIKELASGNREVRYQIRFSDGSLYLWLMPEAR